LVKKGVSSLLPKSARVFMFFFRRQLFSKTRKRDGKEGSWAETNFWKKKKDEE
jgi:hypothetical protein